MQKIATEHYQQQGAALITALVVLVLLTLLGISSLSTTTLEERMAANSQEINRDFQASDSGIAKIFQDNDVYNTTNLINKTETIGGRSVTYKSSISEKPMARAEIQALQWGAGNFSRYFIDLSSTATNSKTNAVTTIRAGAFQIAKAEG